MGLEPIFSPWHRGVLPLNYTRLSCNEFLTKLMVGVEPTPYCLQDSCAANCATSAEGRGGRIRTVDHCAPNAACYRYTTPRINHQLTR